MNIFGPKREFRTLNIWCRLYRPNIISDTFP